MRKSLPAPGDPRYPRYKWVVVGLLWLICVFNYADRQAIFSVFKVLEHDYGFNKKELGLIGSAFMAVYALSAALAGQAGDRLVRKWVIIGGLYVWSAITGFTALCSKLWHFVLVRGAEGLGETFYFPASMSLVSDYHAKSTRSRAMGIHQTGVYVGTVVGGASAGWLAQLYGWKTPFIILGAAGIVLGLILASLIREPVRDEAERFESAQTGALAAALSPAAVPGDTPCVAPGSTAQPAPLPLGKFLSELLRTPSALILLTVFLGANFVAMQFLAWLPMYINEKFGLSLAQSGFGGTFFLQVGALAGAAWGGHLADRWRSRHPGGRMLAQAAGALCGAPFIFLVGAAERYAVLVVVMVAFGICKGIYDASIWASLYDVIPASRRGTACGIANTIGWLGGSLGVVLFGALVDAKVVTMSQAFQYIPAIYLVMAVLLALAALRFAAKDIRKA